MKNNILHGLWHGRLETPGQLHIQFMVEFCVKLTVSQWTVLPPVPHLLVLFSAIPCYSVTHFFLYPIDFTQKTCKSIIEAKFFQRSLAAGKRTGTAGKAHCLDVSAKRICSETARIGITLPLCLRNNNWLEKGIFKMKELLVSPNLCPGTWEQILREAISRKDRKVNWNSQHRFITGKSCLTSLITLWWDDWLCGWGESSGCHFPWLYQVCHHSLPCRAGLTLRGTSTNTENGSTETTWSSNGKFYTWYKITSWMSTGWALTTRTAAPMKRTWGSWWVTSWTRASSMSLQ